MSYRMAPAWPWSATPLQKPPEPQEEDRPAEGWEADERNDGDDATVLTWRLVVIAFSIVFAVSFAVAALQIHGHAVHRPVQQDTAVAPTPRQP
jgi:hypothetical protein